MKYENRTNLPESSVRPLIEWTRTIVGEFARKANLLITYRRRSTSFYGRAYYRAMYRNRCKGFPALDPMVIIEIGPTWASREYPYSETYRKRAGSLTYHNWQENFVATLAHELHHIDQYETISKGKTRDEMIAHAGGSLEVDAERFAAFALAEFRKSEQDFISGAITQSAAKQMKQMKTCPRCEREKDIAVDFGYRKVSGKVIPQSYCHVCRRSHARERRGW